jgi:spoIIIJ-associated protein
VTSRVEAEGNTIDEAIDKALRELGIPRERAQVEIVQDARRGVLGFGGQKARVRVGIRRSLDLAPQDGPAAAPSAAPEAKPYVREAAPPTAREPARQPPAARDREPSSESSLDPVRVVRELLGFMDFPGEVESQPGDTPEQPTIRVVTPSGGLLIGRHGQTLDALEYLVNRIVGKQEERGAHVAIDCEGYRERRRRELTEAAQRVADRVRQRGKPHTMDALSPRERRIVHLALAGETEVETRSIGQGHLRRILISPTRRPRGPAPAETP